jgi:hypothetical protein
MLGTYFYHEILRKTVIGFGTLFNNINIRHKDASGTTFSALKVPLAYGPMQKFLARIQQQPELDRETAITLPRLSFEMQGLQYDPTRKTGIAQTFLTKNGTNAKKVYMPVPYNIGFELSIMSKLSDDALQILEQILPYFQPSFNITVNLISSIGEKKDIPIVLESINYSDQYEGGFESRRTIIYTLSFTAKTYLFGPVADNPEGLIKKVDVDYYTSTNVKTAKRNIRYSATPTAKQNYDDDTATVIDGAISEKVTTFKVSATTDLAANQRIIIDTEIMFIRSISGQNVTVYRAYDNTIAAKHEHNAAIGVLSAVDNASIEFGDDFGFDEMTSFFADGKTSSPSQGIDI